MELQLISPGKTEIRHIAWLEVSTHTGNYVIQPGHAPMILILDPRQPLIFRLKTGKMETISFRQALLEINRTLAKVIMTETL